LELKDFYFRVNISAKVLSVVRTKVTLEIPRAYSRLQKTRYSMNPLEATYMHENQVSSYLTFKQGEVVKKR
tara:strand:- start:417 stop:629 length:213 start_codon:yes stop_codon:yes gene_type:complete